jgi:hypothetical protein
MKLQYLPGGRASLVAAVFVLLASGAALVADLTTSDAATTRPLVSVYPIPNDQVASPQSQLARLEEWRAHRDGRGRLR